MTPQADDDYDAAADMTASINECYRAIRERIARGGPPWVPPAVEEHPSAIPKTDLRRIAETGSAIQRRETPYGGIAESFRKCPSAFAAGMASPVGRSSRLRICGLRHNLDVQP